MCLTEHQPYSDMGSSPATTSKAVRPRGDFELDTTQPTSILKLWMSQNTCLFVECHVGADIEPLVSHTAVCSRKSAQFFQSLQSVFIATFRYQPSRREWKEQYPHSKYEPWYHLKQEWQSPGPFARHVASSVCYPVRSYDTSDDTELFQNQQRSRISGGDISEMYSGATIDSIPIPIPPMSLATTNMA